MRTLNVVARMAVAAVILVLAAGAWAEVKVAKSKDGSSYLTDAKGMSLYTFKKDTPGKSACTGNCLAKWPAYYEEKVGVTDGLKDSDFATIKRDDGKNQTTYKGMPLYYFGGDKAPGDTTGQGLMEVWFLATP